MLFKRLDYLNLIKLEQV